LIRNLKHPLSKEIESLRGIILAISPTVREEVKWNSPSYRTTEFFATINTSDKKQLRLILHQGAKGRGLHTKPIVAADYSALIRWLGPDRCMVTANSAKDLKNKAKLLRFLLREWIRLL